jgi:hypothetical protein
LSFAKPGAVIGTFSCDIGISSKNLPFGQIKTAPESQPGTAIDNLLRLNSLFHRKIHEKNEA